MNRFFVYCNANQAYEALTYNDIRCSELKGNIFRVATLSFLSNNYVFLSAEKISEANRLYGISESDNQYPVAFEISVSDGYEINGRFLVNDGVGQYVLAQNPQPISDFGKIENCIGAFVYGHIPFSFVSRVIFENEENKERFIKPGVELWFPEELFSTWEDEPYSSLPKRTISSESLRDASSDIDDQLLPEEKERMTACLQKQIHAKAASYLAIEATKDWKLGTIKANIDSAIIELLDAGTYGFKRLAEEKLDAMADIFQFVDPNVFEQKDPALEDPTSEEHLILRAIFEELARNNFRFDKEILKANETILRIKDRLEPGELGTDMIGFFDLSVQLDSINTFINSRLGNAEEMLTVTKGNDVLYALAICVKNKGKIENVKLDTVDVSQSVRRYAYIISGLVASMADIKGNVKSNRQLERNLSDVCSMRFGDDYSTALIKPKTLAQESFGIVPEIAITVSPQEFKNNLDEADDASLEALYKAEFSSTIPEKEVSSFKIPIIISMDGKEYVVDTPESIDVFKKDFERKLTRKKTEFNKKLFLSWIFDHELGKRRIREVFDKYRGFTL